MLKPLEVLSIIATVRSQSLCHLSAKITCGLKSLTLADSEVITSDVVETVTSETWLKFRDQDLVIKAETKTWKFEIKTSHFYDGN